MSTSTHALLLVVPRPSLPTPQHGTSRGLLYTSIQGSPRSTDMLGWRIPTVPPRRKKSSHGCCRRDTIASISERRFQLECVPLNAAFQQHPSASCQRSLRIRPRLPPPVCCRCSVPLIAYNPLTFLIHVIS